MATQFVTKDLLIQGTLDGTPSGGTLDLTNVTKTLGSIGTPTSGTLTNCTGLPISGIISSTSLALGVGSIELGNATDTTIARSAAGIATLEGRVIESSLVGVKSADQTKTSDAVMANDADMAVTLPAGTYRISVHAIYANANTSSQVQGKINFTGTATAATGTLEAGLHTAAGIRGSYPNSADADLFAPTFSNTGQNQWYIVQGTLIVTVQGVLSWRWAQYASSANSITLKKGSILIATKLT